MANVDLETVKFMSSEQFDEMGSTALSSINFVEQGILPSEKYDDLVIPAATSVDFIAPADGIYVFIVGINASNVNRGVQNYSSNWQDVTNTYNSNALGTVIAPAKKGETVHLWSNNGNFSTTHMARFYYY